MHLTLKSARTGHRPNLVERRSEAGRFHIDPPNSLEANVFVVQIEALEGDWLGVDAAGGDDAKVANELHGHVQCWFNAHHFTHDVGTPAICQLLDLGNGVVVGEVESLLCAVLLCLDQSVGYAVDGIHVLRSQGGGVSTCACRSLSFPTHLEKVRGSRDSAEADGAASNDDGRDIVPLCFAQHLPCIVGDKVAGGEDLQGQSCSR